MVDSKHDLSKDPVKAKEDAEARKSKLRQEVKEEMARINNLSDAELHEMWLKSEIISSDLEDSPLLRDLFKPNHEKALIRELVKRKPNFIYKQIELRDHFKRWNDLEEAKERASGASRLAWWSLAVAVLALLSPLIAHIWKMIWS